jgi:hypothetical protein
MPLFLQPGIFTRGDFTIFDGGLKPEFIWLFVIAKASGCHDFGRGRRTANPRQELENVRRGHHAAESSQSLVQHKRPRCRCTSKTAT